MTTRKLEIIVMSLVNLEEQVIGVVTNLQFTENSHVIFTNLRRYKSHLMFNELSKFDVKIDAIPNGLGKNVAFFLNKNLLTVCNL